MTTKRLTKRELREDPALEAYHNTSEWIRNPENSGTLRNILIGAGAVVVIVVGLVLMRANAARDEEVASEALLKAEIALNNGDRTAAMAGFTEIQNKYAGSASAMRSIRDMADAKFLAGDVAGAQAGYEKFLGRARKGTMDERAGLIGLATCYEQLKQFPKAAETFEKAAAVPGTSEFQAMGLWAAGRCWNESAQYDKAAGAYRRIVTELPLSRYNGVAKQELAEAEARLGH